MPLPWVPSKSFVNDGRAILTACAQSPNQSLMEWTGKTVNLKCPYFFLPFFLSQFQSFGEATVLTRGSFRIGIKPRIGKGTRELVSAKKEWFLPPSLRNKTTPEMKWEKRRGWRRRASDLQCWICKARYILSLKQAHFWVSHNINLLSPLVPLQLLEYIYLKIYISMSRTMIIMHNEF